MRKSEGWMPPGAVLAAAMILVSGCASTPHSRSDAMVESARVAAAEIEMESAQLNAALESLDRLVNSPGGDLRMQFGVYNQSVDGLYDSIKRAELAFQRMQKLNAEYWRDWEKQFASMNYEVTREHIQVRKKAAQAEAWQVTRRYVAAREALLPVLAYLEDIRKVLHADLTPGGVASMKTIAANAVGNGRKVQTALAQVSDQMGGSGRRAVASNVATAPSQSAPVAPAPEAVGAVSAHFRQPDRGNGFVAWIKTTVFRMKSDNDRAQGAAESP